MKDRREFLKKASLVGIIGSAGPASLFSQSGGSNPNLMAESIIIKNPKGKTYFMPLENMELDLLRPGKINVYDGKGHNYASIDAQNNASFTVGGHLGTHFIILTDKKGKILDIDVFDVDCQTQVSDDSGEFEKIYKMLAFEINNSNYSMARVVRLNDNLYHYFSSWFQDHMYIMQAKKYFYPELKSGIDLYFEGQRKDGMFHDNYKHKNEEDGPWSRRFDYGNFVKVPDDKNATAIFVRVPVENIAEFSMIEGTYFTWKAVGDDAWMAQKLDGLIKGVKYMTSDPYRWSTKFNLIKKGYTIDIWDFQNNYDAALVGHDVMRIELGKSPFGIMFADNVRMAFSCALLAEMLEYQGRTKEAEEMKSLGQQLKERVDKLSWNGQFYTHWIPEDPSRTYDYGVDEKSQVTISNAYALNHGVSHPQAVAIIQTYQRIRNEMPETSPGEWYCCYPPFERGWHHGKWTYMNGGVSPITAGQLAKGAYEHGFEQYGTDILRRVYALVQKEGGKMLGGYRGAFPDKPKREFTPISLLAVANADISGKGAKNVPGWTGEGDNDLHAFPVGRQTFEDVPFDVVDPSANNRKSCMVLSGSTGYQTSIDVPVNKTATGIYLVHACSQTDFPGYISLHYKDKTNWVKPIKSPLVGNWWNPEVSKSNNPKAKVAWRGANNVNNNVGVYIAGINNPHPDKTIEKISFHGPLDNAKWMILGLTLSDQPYFFMPDHENTIPSHWAAAECFYGFMEGLCGITDNGVAFNRASLAPRWESTNSSGASVTAKYEASGGYMSYQYKKTNNNELQLMFTGSAQETMVQVLLPKGKTAKAMLLNGQPVTFENEKVENSGYAKTIVKGVGVHSISITLG